jgi:hypothetical protein
MMLPGKIDRFIEFWLPDSQPEKLRKLGKAGHAGANPNIRHDNLEEDPVSSGHSRPLVSTPRGPKSIFPFK